MLRVLLLSIILLAGALCAPARAEWRGEDTAREVAYLALHVADWGQTLDIENHPDLRETNPVLGEHPSRDRINRYFIITGLLHPVVSYLLPERQREWWQWGTIGLQAVVVGHNKSIGLGFGF